MTLLLILHNLNACIYGENYEIFGRSQAVRAKAVIKKLFDHGLFNALLRVIQIVRVPSQLATVKLWTIPLTRASYRVKNYRS